MRPMDVIPSAARDLLQAGETPRALRATARESIGAIGRALALAGVLMFPPVLAAQAEPATIKPGMTDAEVRTAWGEPLIARKAGIHTYLFYQNDCLRTCGTYDVVILESGQVVDAIVRASYHRYEGTSSSPSDRKPEYTSPS